MVRRSLLAISLAFPILALAAQQAGPPDARAMLAEQKTKIAALDAMNGVWRGEAVHTDEAGKSHRFTQTERVGPMLDGSIKVIEGRGYNPDGSVGFNAFAILSWDSRAQAYRFRSYAMGNAGDFDFKPTADGFVWEVPAGPMTIRYTTTVRGGSWHEVGDRVLPDGKTVRFFEMTLKRIGSTAWPAGEAVPPR